MGSHCDYFAMQHIERRTLQLWAFLDRDENNQKLIKKWIKKFILFSVVKYEYLDQFL